MCIVIVRLPFKRQDDEVHQLCLYANEKKYVVNVFNLAIGLENLSTKSSTNGPRQHQHSSKIFDVVLYVVLQNY